MFTIAISVISLLAAQSCGQCQTFQPSLMPSCQPCQTSMPSFQMPSIPTSTCQCQMMPPVSPIPPPPVVPSPCGGCSLPPPPVQEGMQDQLRYHSDAANRQGCQDTMRANAAAAGQNAVSDQRCAQQNAKMNMDANIATQNNQFREVNENEFLVHKKNAREECGDSSQRAARIDMDAGSGCRAAQSHNDAHQSSMLGGRDRSSRAEDCMQTNIDGMRSGYAMHPRNFGACFF